MHELGHGLGISHDTELVAPYPKLVSLMDEYPPNGGDFGGDQGSNPTANMLRVGTYEFYALKSVKTVLDPDYTNVMIKKYKPGHGPAGNKSALELWTSSHYTNHGADWSWRPGESFGWVTPNLYEVPKGIHPVMVSVNSNGGVSKAKVEYFIVDDAGASATCSEDNGQKIGESLVNYGNPLVTGNDYQVGLFTQDPFLSVPCDPDPLIEVGHWYKRCAKFKG
jgi:hypothetical protein